MLEWWDSLLAPGILISEDFYRDLSGRQGWKYWMVETLLDARVAARIDRHEQMYGCGEDIVGQSRD